MRFLACRFCAILRVARSSKYFLAWSSCCLDRLSSLLGPKRPALERLKAHSAGRAVATPFPSATSSAARRLRRAQAHVDLCRQKRQAKEQKERADRPLDENHGVTTL